MTRRISSRSVARTALVFAGGSLTFSALVLGCSDDPEQSSSTVTVTSSSTAASGGTGGAGGQGAGGTSVSSSSVGGAGGQGGAGGSGGGGASAFDCSAPVGQQAPLKLTEVASGLNRPVLVTAPLGDTERLFIVEQTGVIRLLKDGKLSEFLDIDSIVTTGGERGLLGLAFHPDYANNGRFFVHYSDSSSDTAIAEYRRSSGDPDKADPMPVTAEPLLSVNQPFNNHNGGSIEFSPHDGMLYIGLGDGGAANDPLDAGQDTSSLLGALLRIDVTTLPYSIPAGNLSMGHECGKGAMPPGVCSEIWDYGLRNPYRFSFDPCGGDLYIGDVGQNQWEEIDIAKAGDGGKNWGWRLKEGNNCFNPSNNCDPNNVTTDPAIEYNHSGGKCSVTGGNVYRGSAIGWLRGAYFYGDYCTGDVWMTRWTNGQASAPVDLTDDLGSKGCNVAGFGQDASGEVYLTCYGGSDGVVYRIDAE